MPARKALAYYRLREVAERELAAAAPSAGIHQIHAYLAERYERIVAFRERGLSESVRDSDMVPTSAGSRSSATE